MTVHGADSCWTTKEIDSLAALLLTQLAAVHAHPNDAQDDAEPAVSVQRRQGIPGLECTANGRVVQSWFTGGVSFQQVVNELENETLLKTAAGTFDFQPQHFHADAAAQGFIKKASDHSYFIFDSFKQFDGRLYVALNNFSGEQNALALLHDDLSTCEVIGHFNTVKSIITRLFPTRRIRSFVSPSHLGRLFRQRLQVSPRQHLKQVRLERAAQLLCSSADAVAAVARRVG